VLASYIRQEVAGERIIFEIQMGQKAGRKPTNFDTAFTFEMPGAFLDS